MGASVTGVNELAAAFRQLDEKVQRRTAGRMVAAAGQLVKREAKNIARSKGLVRTGTLVANIAIKRERAAQPGTVQYNVGVRHGREFGKRKNVVKYLAHDKRTGRVKTRYKNDPYYWRFLEFGTRYVRPSKFLAPALDNKKNEAIGVMNKVLQDELNKGKA